MKRSRACSDLLALESSATSSSLPSTDMKRRCTSVSNIPIYRGDSDDSVNSLSEEFACSLWTNFLENGVVHHRNFGGNRSWAMDSDDSAEGDDSNFDTTSKAFIKQITSGALYCKLRRPSIDVYITHPSHAIRKGSFDMQRSQY